YLVDMVVRSDCRLVGQTVEDAGLRHLPGLYLIQITRGGQALSPVRPDEILRARDRLTFTGVVTSIVDLEKIPGLDPAVHQPLGAAGGAPPGQHFCEAVISPQSPLIGETIREADFRALYNAAVVAVHRGGTRLIGRVGDIVLQPGDTLLLQTGPHFARAHRNDPDFILVSRVEEAAAVRRDRAPRALALLLLLLGLAVSGRVSVMLAGFLVAGLMVLTGCLSTAAAREGVNWQTL